MSHPSLTVNDTLPTPAEPRWTLATLGVPAFAMRAFGAPAPQGSKNGFAVSKKGKDGQKVYTGKVAMTESSKKVEPWRAAVAAVAEAETKALPGFQPLDGALVADMVFSMAKPARFPVGDLRRIHGLPTTYPDLSKLIRSTEDALTGIVTADDARIVAYRRSAKFYAGADDPDALWAPGVLIRFWTVTQ